MGQTDHGAFDDAGHGVDLVLDFLRVDIEPPGDDEILAATHDMHIAALVDLAEIAGDEEAVGPELRRRLLGHAPVPLENVRALDLDHADLALRDRRARVGIADAGGHARQGHAHGARDPVAVIGVRGVHVGFGHAVAFENGVTGARPPFPMGFGQQGRRARDEQAHMLRGLRRQVRALQQTGVEGRHAHHGGGARHQAHDGVRVELGQEQHGSARQHEGVGGHEKPVGMIDRQGVDEHVGRAETPEIHQRQGVGSEVVMAQHGAL